MSGDQEKKGNPEKERKYDPRKILIGKSRRKRKPRDPTLYCSNYRLPIDYDSPFHKYWDLLMTVTLIFLCFALPFMLAYIDSDQIPPFMKTLEYVIDVLFIIDIPLHFVTTLENDKGVIDNPFLRAKEYVLSIWFFIDVVSVIPPAWLKPLFSSGGNALRAVKAIKLARINKLKRVIPKIQAHYEIKNSHLNIFKYTLLIMLCGHWIGCVFYLLARLENFQDDSWVNVYQDGGAAGMDALPYKKFITSLYWAITMMSTIGFGDIVPGTYIEIIAAIIAMLLGVGIFAYSVTNMCSVVFGMNVEGGKFACMQDRMKHLLERKSIGNKLKKKIRKYLLYKFHCSSVPMFGGFECLANLSDDLKEDVLKMFCDNLFPHFHILKLFGPRFVRLIAYHLEGQVFSGHEPIMLAGTYCNRIYMLAAGKVEVIYDMEVIQREGKINKSKSNIKMEAKTDKSRSGTSLKGSNSAPDIEKKATSKFGTKFGNSFSDKFPSKKTAHRPRLAAPWDGIRKIKAKVITLMEGISFNEVGCLLSRPATITVFSITYVDIYSITRKHYLDVVAKYYPNDMPKLFQKVIQYRNSVGDLDVALNKPAQDPDADSEDTDNHDQNQHNLNHPQVREIRGKNTPLAKLQILKRNMLLLEKLREKKNENVCDLEALPNEDFESFWKDREGFATKPVPLSKKGSHVSHGKPNEYEGRSVAEILLSFETNPTAEDIKNATNILQGKIAMLQEAINNEIETLTKIIKGLDPSKISSDEEKKTLTNTSTADTESKCGEERNRSGISKTTLLEAKKTTLKTATKTAMKTTMTTTTTTSTSSNTLKKALFVKERTIATQAVLRAARISQRILKELVQEDVVTKKDCSPVTVADYASQAVINLSLQKVFPNDCMIAEEDTNYLREMTSSSKKILEKVTQNVNKVLEEDNENPVDNEQILDAISWTGNCNGRRQWTLDPIDGTKGFLRNEQYAIALALIDGGDVCLGIVGCPNLPIDSNQPEKEKGGIYIAVKGEKTVYRSIDNPRTRTIEVDKIIDAKNAFFVESREPGHSSHELMVRIANSLGITNQPIRMDSQSKYAVVAKGECSIYLRYLPGYIENIWDHAAGAFIVQCAGGTVTDMRGLPLDYTTGMKLKNNVGVVASNTRFHKDIIEITKKLFERPKKLELKV